MTDDLPKEGELISMPDGDLLPVAWCSGWTWPLGEPAPTMLYAQALIDGTPTPELRVIAARDALGTRFWIAERRA